VSEAVPFVLVVVLVLVVGDVGFVHEHEHEYDHEHVHDYEDVTGGCGASVSDPWGCVWPTNVTGVRRDRACSE